ncbi:aminotransferase class V-fold PLP-dependent enzyme [Corynebacterium sp. c9Ua_112]|uniref:Aminotransferase class V-fold PLP-dependent enzyme n=1 Tax=Corynebacterium macclintockiae TaxID=2913501 RepID=A0A9X3M6L2_9CORY|nr:aminotransferase class V-fold PLP-dependent enzyme [Corynebacterium macclintockiae]
MFDVPRVRGLYASLSDGWTYLNAQDFPQVPERVSSAVARSFRVASLLEPPESATGSHSRAQRPGRRIGESFGDSARIAIADLTGARPENVVLGASRAALLDDLAHALYRRLRLGQEVVLSRIDDPANVSPWKHAADLYGARVRWAEPDLSSGVLPAWQYTNLVESETTVVAVSAANRYVGAVTDVRAIADCVRAKSRALLVVDVDSFAPYRVVDVEQMGADVLALDVASLGGPSVGALVFKDDATRREVFHSAHGVGGVSEGLLGGVAEAVDHLARLDDSARGTRRTRLKKGLPRAAEHLNTLATHLVEGLQSLGTVHAIGVDGDGDALEEFASVDRVPRVSFMVDGVPAGVVAQRLLANGVVAGVVAPGQSQLLERMGVFEELPAAPGANSRGRHGRKAADAASAQSSPQSSPQGSAAALGSALGSALEQAGAVSVGFAPHNTAHDVDQLVRVVASVR